MPKHHVPQFAVSTWSIHRVLGIGYPDAPGAPSDGTAEPMFGNGMLTMLDLPAELARRNFHRVEMCHFQLNGRDKGYAGELRASLRSAGVSLQTLLIDDGDLSNATTAKRDSAWIAEWIDIAAALGASHVRVVAGKQKPTPATLQLSIEGLRAAARHGKSQGVRILTENWFDLLAGSEEVHHVLDALDGEVGYLVDTGNWTDAGKFKKLNSVYGRAERSHTKAHFDAAYKMDAGDFRKCLDAAVATGYQGPHTLIYEGPDEEWAGVEMEREFVIRHYVQAGLAAAS